jgi:hypothetical protein
MGPIYLWQPWRGAKLKKNYILNTVARFYLGNFVSPYVDYAYNSKPILGTQMQSITRAGQQWPSLLGQQ